MNRLRSGVMQCLIVVIAIVLCTKRFGRPIPSSKDKTFQDMNPEAPTQPPVPNPMPTLHASDANFRIICNEVAEELSKNWRFKWHITGLMFGALLLICATLGSIAGWGVYTALANERQNFQMQAKQELATAKTAIENQIADEFKKENVRQIVESVADKESKNLLETAVEPSIKLFQMKVDSVGKDIETRFAVFDDIVKMREKEAASNLDTLRVELSRLQDRNEIAALGDNAIAKGDVVSYRKLEALAKRQPSNEKESAALAELFRVYQAYTLFAPSRSGAMKIVASAVNPSKMDETELDAEELLNVLRTMDEPIVRAKIGQLLQTKVKKGSYTTAEALVRVMQKETHLEAFRFLGRAFAAVTGREASGLLDRSDDLKWWEENKQRFKKEDTDSNPSLPSTPK